MDIYRYFHPHHNPRLFSTALRQQELSELEQAASELRKALERARLRTERAAPQRILPSHFTDLIKAVRFLEDSLQTLCDAHEGDSRDELSDLIEERSNLRGWEGWTRIVMEQLASEMRVPSSPKEETELAEAEIEMNGDGRAADRRAGWSSRESSSEQSPRRGEVEDLDLAVGNG